MLPLNGSLSSEQLASALLKNNVTKKYFGGIVARDILCKITKRPRYIVCNTDIVSGEGKHWIVFFFPPHALDTVEMFDSLGKGVDEYPEEFRAFVNKFASQCQIVTKRIQPLNTSLCGHYCLYYILYRCKGIPMNIILDFVPSACCLAKFVQERFG